MKPLLSWKEVIGLVISMTLIMGIYMLPWIKPEWFR